MLDAAARAGQLVAEAFVDETGLLPRLAARGIASVMAEDLPLTREGQLHEPAFLAWLDSLRWEQRDAELTRALAGDGGRA